VNDQLRTFFEIASLHLIDIAFKIDLASGGDKKFIINYAHIFSFHVFKI
jgi:hypothetical protein